MTMTAYEMRAVSDSVGNRFDAEVDAEVELILEAAKIAAERGETILSYVDAGFNNMEAGFCTKTPSATQTAIMDRLRDLGYEVRVARNLRPAGPRDLGLYSSTLTYLEVSWS